MSNQCMRPDEIVAVRQRVEGAFIQLESKGFVVRMNFSCCMSCAIAELGDIAREEKRDRAAYWHEQDEKHFCDGYPLHIRYCYLPRVTTDEDTRALEKDIAERVAAALRDAGLMMEWDGNPSSTIQVTGKMQ